MGTLTLITLAAVVVMTTSCDGAKILLMACNVHSHVFYFGELGKGLLSRGHDVTLLTGSEQRVPRSYVEAGMKLETYAMTSDAAFSSESAFKQDLVATTFNYSFSAYLATMGKLGVRMFAENAQLLEDTAMHERIKGAGYEFAVVDHAGPYFLHLVHMLDIPFGSLGAECSYQTFQAPWMVSSQPNPFLAMFFTGEMSLWQRCVNALVYVLVIPLPLILPTASHVQKYVPERPPMSGADIAATCSLCLRLQENFIAPATPLPPNVINAGGLMGRPGNPLPPDWQAFMDDAEESGVILVSFGSWFDLLPQDIFDKMADAFLRLECRVVWKYTGKVSRELPSRIRLSPWVPQNDLLAHPNTRLFVSHCGVSGVLETLYHGVPVVAMPLMLDQSLNAKAMVTQGYAEQLGISDFTTGDLVQAIRTVLSGPHVQRIRAASAIFKDLPPGSESASFWVEHVIKHGGQYLRPRAMDLPWYQNLALDVMAVFVITFLLLFYVVRICCRWMCLCCCKYCCRRPPNSIRDVRASKKMQ